jgi:phenylacetate-coenzyme A ligase PaaK-like adenylate-forming protein
MQRIEDPQGRLDDIFVYDDGLTVHPHLFRSALADHPEILEYQVRQRETASPSSSSQLRSSTSRRYARASRPGLAALGLTEPRVDIETLDELPRQASGKLKRFVQVPPPTAIR